MSKKLDELRRRGLKSEAFREGYAARDALIQLGTMLRQVRETSGMTQLELAERVGMTQPAVSRIESGFGPHGPEIDTVMRFVQGCDFELVIGVKHRQTAGTAGNESARAGGEQEFHTVLSSRA
jgi:transcriptional regulator with XRE-family HTH domain